MSLIPPATTHSDATAAPVQLVADPGSRWAPLRWVARVLLGLVLTVWSLLLIAWLTLHWGILPHIEQWREPIEQRASKALGVPVIDGVTVAVKMVESLVALGLGTSKVGDYALPLVKQYAGLAAPFSPVLSSRP